MYTKALLPILALSLTAVSCSKEKTASTDMATTVDSATVPVKDTTVVAVPQTDSLDNGNVFHYVTHDGETEFTLTHEPEDGKVIVKNEADGTTYNMKQTVSGSGEKYIDDNGYYFIGHQGEFYFGKDGKDIVTGKRK